jgi:hypothetical protein
VTVCAECIVTGYNGRYHDQVVGQLMTALEAAGANPEKDLILCLPGEVPVCAKPDIFWRNPTTGQLSATEVKTGQDPKWSPNQSLVYLHMREGEILVSPDPRIVTFGWPLDTPLPSIDGMLFYKKDPNTPPIVVPIP